MKSTWKECAPHASPITGAYICTIYTYMHHQTHMCAYMHHIHIHAPYTHTCTTYTHVHHMHHWTHMCTSKHYQKLKYTKLVFPLHSMKDQSKMKDLCWISCFCCFSGAFYMKSPFLGAFHEKCMKCVRKAHHERPLAMNFNPMFLLFQQFFALGIAWLLSGVLTAAGAFTDDKNSIGYKARTDARIGVITESPMLYFPYPCEFPQMTF